MDPDVQRTTIALLCGYSGCTDHNCDFRKAKHLHDKAGRVVFPEPYSIHRYPDYPNDLNACAEMEGFIVQAGGCYTHYVSELQEMTEHNEWRAKAWQRCVAFLKVTGKW